MAGSRDHLAAPAGSVADLGVIQRYRHLFALDAPGLLDSRFPQLDAAVHAGCAAARGKRILVAVPLAVLGLELVAERIVDRLEVIQATRQSLDLVRRRDAECIFVVVHAGEPAALFLETSLVQLLEKRGDTRRNGGVEYHVDPAGHDLVHSRAVLIVVHGKIFLAHDFAAVLDDDLARILVQHMRPHIVGGRQVELLATVLDQPGDKGIALLRRRRAGAEKVRRAFLAFVQLRIDIERLAAVDDGVLDSVAHRTGDAAENDVHLVLGHQLAHLGHRKLLVGGGVFQDHLDRTAEQAAALVDLLDRHFRHLRVGNAAPTDGAGQVGGDADLDRVGGPRAFWIEKIAAAAEGDHARQQAGALHE